MLQTWAEKQLWNCEQMKYLWLKLFSTKVDKENSRPPRSERGRGTLSVDMPGWVFTRDTGEKLQLGHRTSSLSGQWPILILVHLINTFKIVFFKKALQSLLNKNAHVKFKSCSFIYSLMNIVEIQKSIWGWITSPKSSEDFAGMTTSAQ